MKIGLLGHGTVGSGVRKIVDEKNTKEISQLEISKILVRYEKDITDNRMTVDIHDIVDDSEIDVVVECIGGDEPAFSYVQAALFNGKHVVTSNKKMLVNHLEELLELARTRGVSLKYEAACGGGIPWMSNLDRTKRIDDINSFRGIFNGTTNYILSKMSDEGLEFAVALKEAQDCGYAEFDPSDDIDGMDTAYKVVLSSCKGFGVLANIHDIDIYGIRHISAKDIAYACKHGYVCKLIGSGVKSDSGVSGTVIPTFIPKQNIFATIPANFNAIESDSKTLGKMTYVGQGAGSYPTAHAVVQDLIDLVLHQDTEVSSGVGVHVDNKNRLSSFYVRSVNLNRMEDVIEERIDEDTCITKEISFVELASMMKVLEDNAVFVAEVMHDCK
ncbi:homoserine dehydrogenase [uncultured Solobacterium sp.]|jgi:homoserine dehydrogenase|uniref:homoserine dehydrogenase n=1 Tax=uncultured Solobacterium sp. TaxID=747375 RepID=UPI002627D6DC|nr:homoserine dehydrogenase [uncultured Solobacterium sp.]